MDNPCLSGGTLEIFLEAVLPPALVFVYGVAPIARALVELGAAARLRGDARPSPTTVAAGGRSRPRSSRRTAATRRTVLAAAVRAGVPYVGLVASRRRGAVVLAALTELGLPTDAVHTPAGLDIGGRTPAEIALSILRRTGRATTA